MFKGRFFRTVAIAAGWGISLGFIGFAVGASGNSFLDAEPGSAAPLIGFCFTGPTAALVGALLGAMCALLPIRTPYLVAIYLALAVGTAGISLSFTIPDFEPRAELVEATVIGCDPPEAAVLSRIPHWRSETVRVSREGVNTRKEWEETISTMLSGRPGVLISFKRGKSAWIVERAWYNSRRDRKIELWTYAPREQRAFLDQRASDCSAAEARVGQKKFLLLCYEHSEGFPPSGLPEFLGDFVAHVVPEELVKSPARLIDWSVAACGPGWD